MQGDGGEMEAGPGEKINISILISQPSSHAVYYYKAFLPIFVSELYQFPDCVSVSELFFYLGLCLCESISLICFTTTYIPSFDIR